MQGGAGKAHRWTNAVNAATADITAEGKHHPQDIINAVAEEWGKIWESHDVEASRVGAAAVAELRTRTLMSGKAQELALSITPEAVLEASRSMKKSTAIGVDGLAFTEIVKACGQARASLCDFFRQIILNLAWPTQTVN